MVKTIKKTILFILVFLPLSHDQLMNIKGNKRAGLTDISKKISYLLKCLQTIGAIGIKED